MLSRSLSSLARNTESLHDLFFDGCFVFLLFCFFGCFFLMTVLFLDDFIFFDDCFVSWMAVLFFDFLF